MGQLPTPSNRPTLTTNISLLLLTFLHKFLTIGKDKSTNYYFLSCLTIAVAILIMGRSDRKSTRLNSSHLGISYAVFCLKKKKINKTKPKSNSKINNK